jgi:hypothetical protein
MSAPEESPPPGAWQGSSPGEPDPAGGSGPGAGAQPSEEQLRAAYEEELSRISATDMIAQAAVSLLNVGAYRLAPAPSPGDPSGAGAGSGRDLEQARDAIDAVRALLEILERRIPPQELRPLRDALSRLQMAYAHEIGPAQAGAHAAGGGQQPPAGTAQPPAGAPAAGAPLAGEPATGAPPAGEPTAGEPTAGEPPAQGEQPGAGDQTGPGPAEASGRLWVPGR